MEFREQVPLAPLTTLDVGGPARWFAEARSESDVIEAAEFARSRALRLFPLGGGSNLLVSDAGFPGLVLHIGLTGVEENGDAFDAAAGENWDAFVARAVNRNYAGVECLAGIPGTVGGTPVQNVGAYGQEVAGVITSVRALELGAMRFVEIPRDACGFAYRRSIFNTTARGGYIVTSVRYALARDGRPEVAYADLKKRFQSAPAAPSLSEVSRSVREIRRAKGMVLTPGDADCRSAGSFFKNPVVSFEEFERLATREAVEIPHYPAGSGRVKIPAAWLLERAGFHKGHVRGAAAISSRHTLALINRGAARAADILALRDEIVSAVQSRFGVRLEQEPVFLG